MAKKRVVITGMGAVTPVGNNLNDYWQSLCDGKNGIGKLTRFEEPSLRAQIAGQVDDYDPAVHMDKKDMRKTDRFVHFAAGATRMAVEHAGLDPEKVDTERVAVIYGSGIGGLITYSEQHTLMLGKGVRRVSPMFIPMMIIDMAAGYLSMVYGFKGPNFGVVSACASGSHAIGEAMRCLQFGDADVVITGGAEATITPIGFAGFCSARALSTRNDDPAHASRPFDKERDGFIMSEGGGTLVLETLEHARARGANILAELTGYGRSGDAHHMTAPAPEGTGAARAIRWALKDAGVTPEQIDYVNAHGTSTELNDKYETMAIKSVFGEAARSVSISSTKSMTGHLLGASGAIEMIACVRAINESVIPPTINQETPDPDCDLDYTPNVKKEMAVNTAISNSFGFGGHNVCLVVKKFQP